jgi:hypothetical protein
VPRASTDPWIALLDGYQPAFLVGAAPLAVGAVLVAARLLERLAR